MTKLYITRHGQTQWNLEGRLQGRKDSSLTKLGEEQAKWLSEKLKGFEIDIIISSPSGRALKTAEILRGDRDIEIIQNSNLMEMNFGDWEGQLHSEIEKQSPVEKENYSKFPHLYVSISGETFYQVLDRVGNEIEKIISKHEGQSILVVTHAVVLKAIFTYLENKEVKDLWSGAFMHPTCLNIIDIKNGSREIVLQGDISHYQE